MDKKNTGEPYLRRNPCSFVLLNTTTMTRGIQFWDPARQVGTKGETVTQEKKEALLKSRKELGSGEMHLLTFWNKFTFNHDIVWGQLGLGKCCAGNGVRLYQGRDQVNLRFKRKEEAKYQKEGRVYMQVDGEYFIVHYPDQLQIRYLKQVNVLDGRKR